MSDSEFREREVLIERYRHLQREVTDPMAAGLLQWIVFELEQELPVRSSMGELPRQYRPDVELAVENLQRNDR